MIIGLDWDQTYTADPILWNQFIACAKERGHKVVCVTARRETEENVVECDIPGVLTYFTGASAKEWYMEQRGVNIDIWIDDCPGAILNGF